MSNKITEQELAEKYSEMTLPELKDEVNNVLFLTDYYPDLDAQSILFKEFRKRGIDMGTNYTSNADVTPMEKLEATGVKLATRFLGLLLIVGGIALSASTERVFYGAILVGILLLVNSLRR